jgi:paraquat-inducible protein B
VLLFSSGSLFHVQQKYILYFTTSLKGLDPGAPVKFRGVTIGKVQEVLIRHNQASDDFAMPVIISIDTKLSQTKSDELLQFGKSRLDLLVQRGFRGRLDSESLVTGVLYIGMELLPNPPPPVFHQLKEQYPEIPTVPSQVQQLLAKLEQLDVEGLSDKLSTLLSRLDTGLGQLNIAEINAGLTNLLGAANRFVSTPDLTNSIVALRGTLDNAQGLLKRINGHIDPLVGSVTNTLNDAQKTLADVRIGVRNIADLLGPDSALRPDLIRTLEELGEASRAVADLAEFLKRNPNTLLTGIKRPKEQP